jgi:aminoglycoside phosphotransferase (APT) family kinase protein
MERLDGEALPRRILRDAAYDAIRPRLAAECGEILARVHAMDAGALRAAGVADEEPVAALRATLDRFDEPRPVFELGLRWLERHRPRPGPGGPVVVHGDFRHGNLLIAPDGVRAVLDWELVHLGDPMEDLGWLCVRAWRFGGAGPVGGFGTYEDLFAAYERAGGGPVDPDVVRWWEVVGTLRWGVICMIQAERHLSGRERSVELAAIGRRTVEQEYDLLRLIEDRLGDG